MEIILSILFVLGIVAYFKYQDGKATVHCNTYEIDWGKVVEDRTMNNLSNTQINRNIASGKYDTGNKW